MLTKKENLEAIEKFSENLEIEGRSLWQDARIRFYAQQSGNGELIPSCSNDVGGDYSANDRTAHL